MLSLNPAQRPSLEELEDILIQKLGNIALLNANFEEEYTNKMTSIK